MYENVKKKLDIEYFIRRHFNKNVFSYFDIELLEIIIMVPGCSVRRLGS